MHIYIYISVMCMHICVHIYKYTYTPAYHNRQKKILFVIFTLFSFLHRSKILLCFDHLYFSLFKDCFSQVVDILNVFFFVYNCTLEYCRFYNYFEHNSNDVDMCPSLGLNSFMFFIIITLQ